MDPLPCRVHYGEDNPFLHTPVVLPGRADARRFWRRQRARQSATRHRKDSDSPLGFHTLSKWWVFTSTFRAKAKGGEFLPQGQPGDAQPGRGPGEVPLRERQSLREEFAFDALNNAAVDVAQLTAPGGL